MHVIIVGAGDLGCFLATLLSREGHGVLLVDNDAKKLTAAAENLDVAFKEGSGSDWRLLEELLDYHPGIFVAVTRNDETNLVACTLAKHLGIPHTIARVKDNSFLNRARLDFGHIFDVDFFICPELMIAYDILKILKQPSSLYLDYFSHGAMEMRTLKIPNEFLWQHIPLKELTLPPGVMIGLILRENELIFPHGNDVIIAGDEITVLGETYAIEEIHHFFAVAQKKIKSVFLAGGSFIAGQLAMLLIKRNIQVRLMEKDSNCARELAKMLPKASIIAADWMDVDVLKEENVAAADMFIVSSDSDEHNLIGSLMAKRAGVDRVTGILSAESFFPLAEDCGMDHVVSSKAQVGDRILSRILSKQASSLVSLYEGRVEVVEAIMSEDSPYAGIPLSVLGPSLPSEFLISMVQSQGKASVACGEHVIVPGDTVMVICAKEHVKHLDKIF